MPHVWSISYNISMASFLLYQLCQAILFLLQFGMRLSSSAADSSATFMYPIMYTWPDKYLYMYTYYVYVQDNYAYMYR